VDVAYINLALGAPDVIGGLHPDPNVGAVAELPAETNGDGRRDRLLLLQNAIERLL